MLALANGMFAVKSAFPNEWQEVQGPNQEQWPQLGDAAAVAAVPKINRIG